MAKMKYLKYFESMENGPEIGDYVVCEDNEGDSEDDIEFINFLELSIGIVLDTNRNKEGFFSTQVGERFQIFKNELFLIKFENELPEFIVEPDLPKNSLIFHDEEIVAFSKNRDELEIILSANKYNI
jgi:hypothetical protein